MRSVNIFQCKLQSPWQLKFILCSVFSAGRLIEFPMNLCDTDQKVADRPLAFDSAEQILLMTCNQKLSGASE